MAGILSLWFSRKRIVVRETYITLSLTVT